MPSMYQPLSDYLASQIVDEVTLSFADLEQILGRRLPRSAFIAGWWSNSWSTPHSRAWQAAGWGVTPTGRNDNGPAAA